MFTFLISVVMSIKKELESYSFSMKIYNWKALHKNFKSYTSSKHVTFHPIKQLKRSQGKYLTLNLKRDRKLERNMTS